MKKSQIDRIFSTVRKLATATLAFVVAISSFSFANASVGESSEKTVVIRSNEVKADITNYASNILPKHLHALKTAKELEPTDECFLGQPFEIYNTESKKAVVYYPVVDEDKIIAILQVSKKEGEYNSILSRAFSKELEELLSQNNGGQYTLFTDGNSLYAYDDKTAKAIYSLNSSATTYDARSSEDYTVATTCTLTLSDLKTSVVSGQDRTMLLGPVQPVEANVLPVAGVSQYNHDTCWAATCAAIINYYKGTYLSHEDVAKFVYGKDWDKGGTLDDIKNAYNHWGLYPSLTKSSISFIRVKDNINQGNPMDLGLTRHEVGLIGYEEWHSNYSGDRVLILLEPNGGRRESVTLDSWGNFAYMLNGVNRSWQETFEF